MVGHQSQALDGTQDRRPAHAGWSGGGADGQLLRAATAHPRPARVYRSSVEGKWQSVGVFPRAGADLPAGLRGLDSYGQTTGDAGKAHSGIGPSTRGRKETRLEVVERDRAYL